MATSPRRGADRAALRDRQHQCPPPEKRAAVLNPAQIAQMLRIAEPRDAALVAVMISGACRIGEVLLLCWSDIDAHGIVTVPGVVTKTGRSRAFTLPAQALRHLEAWRSQCPASQRGWLFPGHPVRQPLSVRAGQLAIRRLAEHLWVQGSAPTASADPPSPLPTRRGCRLEPWPSCRAIRAWQACSATSMPMPPEFRRMRRGRCCLSLAKGRGEGCSGGRSTPESPQ